LDNAAPDSLARRDLFLVSLLILFLELACIRWFPAHVLFLTFFTNTILLASFLGMSMGCLNAGRQRDLLADTPIVLVVTMFAAQFVGIVRNGLEGTLGVGNQASPQLVFFGTEYSARDPAQFVIPIEAVEGFFFLMVALVMVGPGQELGRAFKRVPNRLHAYTLNIAGSLAGVLLFAACSRFELSPLWWFTVVVGMLGYFLLARSPLRRRVRRADVPPALGAIVAVAFWTSGIYSAGGDPVEHLWSPYYRIAYDEAAGRQISVNLIGHQSMVGRDDDAHPSYAYDLPYLLQRDSGGAPFKNVLVIGAGSGNDVSRALAWGATHIDAVEIDPAIQRLGAEHHPDRPYQDPRVTVHLGDGRNFLRVSRTKYDLVVFALVDSLVLHSSHSNIRLESFMFTEEALADVRRNLAPNGVLAMYNFFRQGWVVDRLDREVRDVFGRPALTLTLPFRTVVDPETSGGFTFLLAGATGAVRDAFQQHGSYWLAAGSSPSPATPNGFAAHADGPADGWVRFGPARVIQPQSQRSATDDWPFLYLRNPMIPDLSLRGIAVMGGISLLLFLLLRQGSASLGRFRPDGRMFFLGAGFMLVETKAVVDMALLFGSTWMVNTIVFAGIMVMILGANLYTWRVKPSTVTRYYIGLMLALVLNLIVPLDIFLGWGRSAQIVAACLLAFTPVLFSGVIFAITFERSSHPDADFGTNVMGAMVGGLAENTSMLLGFRLLTVVVITFYALSVLLGRAPVLAAQPELRAEST
jgi:spermidine synthase